MLFLIGIVVTMVMVFGGFVLAGGKFGIIIKALPFELMMIGGAAMGAFMCSNKSSVVKKTLKSLKLAFGNGKWKQQDYADLLALLFTILKLVRSKGMIALEQHIEKPSESPIFSQYPKIAADHFAVDFICDTLRMMTMNFEDPHQVEDMMEKQLEKHHHEVAAPAHALQTMADGIPALGIVAAVLGVIKTMGSIDAEVTILGGMIGGALVGTFLGVFLGYTIVGPMASKINQVVDMDHQFYLIIRDVLVAHLQGNAAQVSVEIGRGNIPSVYQPTFLEMEEALSSVSVPG
ncbi:MAG: flagellar motor stator protein MotA [Rickettsiales bacterium]|nr:flagellar motor stator protein MotA [Rickettsiales bacterium]